MMTTILSILDRLSSGPNSGYFVLLVAGIFCAANACIADYFVDESDSPPMSEADKEQYGLKATKVTRPIMVGIFLLVAGFATWKMWQR